MKTLDEYLSLPYRMELTPDPDEGGYAVSFPDLPGCLSVGETIDEAVANAEDAKREWLAAAIEDGYTINEPDSIENYSGQFKLRIPKSLHKSLSDHAKEEVVSMNQYCVYLLSRNDSAIHAMNKFQEQMDGQAGKAGLNSEEDVAEWITESRRENQ